MWPDDSELSRNVRAGQTGFPTSSVDASGPPGLARYARGRRFDSCTPHPSRPPNPLGGLDLDRWFDSEAPIDGVRRVLPERVGHVLVAAQHPDACGSSDPPLPRRARWCA
jgi:hypothetical protein